MSENPTGDAGASTTERIEQFLSDSDQSNEVPQEIGESQETPEVVETADDAQTGSDEPQLSLTDLAIYLGVEESALDVDTEGAPIFKTKIDGQDGTVKFQDLVKSYQLQGHVDQQVRQAAEERKAIQQRVQEFEAHATEQLNQLANVAKAADQMLMQEFQNVNWQELARTDPAQYVALEAEYKAKQGQIQQLMHAVNQQTAQARQAQQAKFQEKVVQAAETIKTQVEGWQPGNEVDISLQKFAHENGFTNTAEIMAEYPQAARILWEAQQYRSGKQSASLAEKQVRQAPKLVKPGQSIDARQKAQETTRGLKEQIRKSGGKTGIQEYLLRTGKV